MTIALKKSLCHTIDLTIVLTNWLEKLLTWKLPWRTFVVTQLTWQLPWQLFWKYNWLDNCLDLKISLTPMPTLHAPSVKPFKIKLVAYFFCSVGAFSRSGKASGCVRNTFTFAFAKLQICLFSIVQSLILKIWKAL